MFNSFKKILIPIDLSSNTEVAVKKGLELAESGTTIHLLHVVNEPPVGYKLFTAGKSSSSNIAEIENKMQQWKKTIEEYREGILVNTWLAMECCVQNAIEIKAKQLGADLIIICKKSKHSWFPFLNTVSPNRLVHSTGKTVLTVKPGSIYNKVKTIIVPVSGKTADHKMEIIATICQKFRVKVYLVTFLNGEPSDFYASHLLQLYQWIKSNFHCPVEYAALYGSNKAKAILKYAEKVNADMLLVYPEVETKIGWLNTHISDVLPPASKVQVLAVQPATY
jgi:nucleotide-binding universal stress UspA family protein